MSDIIATDLDLIIAQGYSQLEAKIALRNTHGDRHAAVSLLVNQSHGRRKEVNESQWRNEKDDDWVSYINTSSLPFDAESRALLKSPIYARVSSVRTVASGSGSTEVVLFEIKVVLKDKRSWVIERFV